jgi:hypothetical protein
MRFITAKLIVVAAVLALTWAPQMAGAAEKTGSAIADFILQGMEASGGGEITYSSVSGSGSRARIKDLSVRIVRDGRTVTLAISALEVDDAAIDADGRMSAAKITMTGVDASYDEGRLIIGSMVFTDAKLPTADEIRSRSQDASMSSPGSTGVARDIVLRPTAGGEIPIEVVEFTAGEVVQGLLTSGAMVVTNAVVTAQMFKDDAFTARIGDLGYDKLMLGLDFSFAYDAAAGILDLDKFAISAVDAGTLLMTAKIGNLTPDLLKKMSGLADADRMAAMQSLTVNALSVRLDNNSVVDRALDMQAKQMGVSRDQFVAQMVGAMPLMLSILQNPDFQNKVSSALGVFLKDPRSLSATATPAQPLPVMQIMGAAMMAPQSIPTLLNVTIEANR